MKGNGLYNFGNSCYLAVCIQSFRLFPEIRNSLANTINSLNGVQKYLHAGLQDLLQESDILGTNMQLFHAVYCIISSIIDGKKQKLHQDCIECLQCFLLKSEIPRVIL
jgi:uncharacterized UBP type Zn finger protein